MPSNKAVLFRISGRPLGCCRVSSYFLTCNDVYQALVCPPPPHTFPRALVALLYHVNKPRLPRPAWRKRAVRILLVIASYARILIKSDVMESGALSYIAVGISKDSHGPLWASIQRHLSVRSLQRNEIDIALLLCLSARNVTQFSLAYVETILKWIFKCLCVCVCVCVVLTCSAGGRCQPAGFIRRRGISWRAEQLRASQWRFSSVKLGVCSWGQNATLLHSAFVYVILNTNLST